MPMLQEWLRRFQQAGVPGSPATAGVPLDRTAGLESELRPLLAQLDAAERRTKAVEEQFDLRGQKLIADATTRAQQLIAEAHVSAEAERDHAIRDRRAAAAREREDLLSEARAEADRVRRQSARELADLAGEAVALVLASASPPP